MLKTSKTIFSTVTLFGIPLVVSPLTKFVATVVRQLSAHPQNLQTITPQAIMVVSMQDVMARRFQPNIRQAFDSFDIFTMDGMPLVWLARLLGYPADRIYGPDLLVAMLDQTHTKSRPLRHYFYGGTPAVLRALQQNLRARWPGAIVAGSYAPPFRRLNARELTAVIKKINATQPDIIWVGLGSSKQLEWVHQVKPRLRTQLIVPVGMAFDVLAGVKKQAPQWVRRAGLEWLYRLIQEPARLWRRYVWQVPVFAGWWLVELIKAWPRR